MSDAPLIDDRLTVLSNPGRWRKGDNPFLKLMFEELSTRVELIPFSWRKALLSRYDLLHVHWMEYVLLGPSFRVRLAKRTLFLLLLIRLLITRTPSVWTVHNESPHDDTTRVEKMLFRLWAHRVSHKVLLTSTSSWAAAADASVIPHGHYRPTLQGPDRPREARETPHFLLFGHLRAYKGIEQLIDVVGTMQSETPMLAPTLGIVGRATEPSYEAALRERADSYPGIRLTLEFLDDADLEQEIYRADCIVLPYRRMLNSGAALLALSCSRPILVPDSPSMLELRAELGDRWVHTFTPPLQADDFVSAMRILATTDSEDDPDLSRRDWPVIADEYLAIYRRLLAARR